MESKRAHSCWKQGKGSMTPQVSSPACVYLYIRWLSSSFLPIFFPELFPAPILRAVPSAEPQAGGPMTLSCQTKLPLQRSAARLLFSFYKDGRIVQSRGLSSEFQIPTASEDHSGSYRCEAATEDNQVWKQSPQLEIRVQGEFVSECRLSVWHACE